jgi:hypothetical protein
MRVTGNKFLRRLILTSIYMIGVIGIVASGGGDGGGSNPPPESDTNCVIDTAKIGECKI